MSTYLTRLSAMLPARQRPDQHAGEEDQPDEADQRASVTPPTIDQISFAIATAVSAMRFEKPHSLSYQATTRTNVPSDHLGLVHVERRRVRIVVEVDRDVRLVGQGQDALQRPLAARFTRGVDLFHGGRLLGDELEVDHRDVRRRHADRDAVELALRARAARGRSPWRRRSRSGSSTAPRRGRGRDPCAWCRASAGRRCRRGSWS